MNLGPAEVNRVPVTTIALTLLRSDICDGDTVRVEAEGFWLLVGKAERGS